MKDINKMTLEEVRDALSKVDADFASVREEYWTERLPLIHQERHLKYMQALFADCPDYSHGGTTRNAEFNEFMEADALCEDDVTERMTHKI